MFVAVPPEMGMVKNELLLKQGVSLTQTIAALQYCIDVLEEQGADPVQVVSKGVVLDIPCESRYTTGSKEPADADALDRSLKSLQ